MNQKKARAESCNFIRVFRLSAKRKLKSEKEDKFKSLNIDTCGRSFKLSDSQRHGLSSNDKTKVTVIHQVTGGCPLSREKAVEDVNTRVGFCFLVGVMLNFDWSIFSWPIQIENKSD